MKTITTDLSKFSRCLIRQKWVVQTPEERVRQRVLAEMVGTLGFPRGLISVEKKIGGRRYDIAVYTPRMDPLLLIECKAERFEGAENQAFGYNSTIQAPFICVACAFEIKTMWQEKNRIVFVPFLPRYQELYDISRRG